MKRIAVIALVSYLAFAGEFFLYNVLGPWGKPELLFLVVVFFNLYLGIRFSIIAAVFCGLLKDACGVAPWGTYLVVFMAAAFLTALVHRYLYQQGSKVSRILVAFLVMAACLALQAALSVRNNDMDLKELFSNVFAPQLITTLLVATFVFQMLRDVSVFFTLKK